MDSISKHSKVIGIAAGVAAVATGYTSFSSLLLNIGIAST